MKKNFISLILSFVIVIATLYQSRTFYNDNDLADIKCGLPMSFIQGASLRNPPFPFRTACIEAFYIFPRENYAQILWPVFFLNVIIAFGFLSLIVYSYHLFSKFGKRKAVI
jgi:hypothetical protein